MTLKLKCVKDCYLEEITIKRGDVVRALITDGENGIRFQQPDKIYSYPYYISDVEDCFISAFDEEEYNRRFKKVKRVKAYVGEKLLLEADEDVVSFDGQ